MYLPFNLFESLTFCPNLGKRGVGISPFPGKNSIMNVFVFISSVIVLYVLGFRDILEYGVSQSYLGVH